MEAGFLLYSPCFSQGYQFILLHFFRSILMSGGAGRKKPPFPPLENLCSNDISTLNSSMQKMQKKVICDVSKKINASTCGGFKIVAVSGTNLIKKFSKNFPPFSRISRPLTA